MVKYINVIFIVAMLVAEGCCFDLLSYSDDSDEDYHSHQKKKKQDLGEFIFDNNS